MSWRVSWRAWGAGASLGTLVACVQIGAFPCDQDSQCALDGSLGRCLSPGYCAFPDATCDDGYRWYEPSVPDALAGQCASVPDEGSTSPPDPPASTSGEGSSTSGEGSSTSGSTSDGSDGSSSSGGGSCGDHPCPCARSVAVGNNHTCVARTDGRVVCWGADSQGQLGQGPGGGPLPGPLLVPLPGEEIIDVVQASTNGNCARGAGSVVWCWGDNNNGEITTPDASPGWSLSPTALPLEGVPGALGQSAQHTCVGDAEGTGVRCLGNDEYSELGGGGPQPVDGAVPGMNPVDQLALGLEHSCALAAGQVWCWGRDNVGQLGQNMVDGPTPDPTPVSLPSDAVFLVAGDRHNCAAINQGNAVRCWGQGVQGQIGDGTTNNRQFPTAIDTQPSSAVIAMSAREDTTCMLLADESLWCWGDQRGGSLGTDVANGTKLLVPERVHTVEELPEPLVEFGLGQAHICGRADTGRLWCWGRSSGWQLGPVLPPPGMDAVELDLSCPAD